MWLIVQFSAVLLLGLVLFVSPSNFSALVVVGDQRVGLLKKCVGTRCDDWLKIGKQYTGHVRWQIPDEGPHG